MGLLISIGKWGGLYLYWHGFAPRLCLGWIAITLFFTDGDDILELAATSEINSNNFKIQNETLEVLLNENYRLKNTNAVLRGETK